MIGLSVVIVSYKVKDLLKKCLESVLLASKNINTEVFVVDNASDDGTVGMVKKQFPQVKLISNKENIGFSKANNQALKKAKGKYLLILNPDTELEKDSLDKIYQFIEKTPDTVAAVTCRVQLPDGTIDRDCRRSFPTPWRALTHFLGLSKIFKGSKIFDQYYIGYISENIETEVDACVGAFMLIKKSALEKVGLFDEDYFFYGEDLDLCFRINKAGYKIIYTPVTKITHHKGASSGIKKHTAELSKAPQESRRRAIIESTRAMELFYKKHYVKNYPLYVTAPVLFAILLVKYLRIAKLNLR